LSDHGKKLITGSYREARLWKTSGQLIRTIGSHFQFIRAVAFSPSNSGLIIGDERGVIESFSQDGRKRTGILPPPGINATVQDFVLDATGRKMIVAYGNGYNSYFIYDVPNGSVQSAALPATIWSVGLSRDGKLAVTGSGDQFTRLWDTDTGQKKGEFHDPGVVLGVGFAASDQLLVSYSDKTLQLRTVSSPNQMLQLFDLPDNRWAVVGEDGRFDTNELENSHELNWLMSDDPMRPLPLEIFMRGYYEPGLLRRRISCTKAQETDPDACTREFKAVTAVSELNRIQPEVKILSVRRGRSADEALVEVEALGNKDPTQPNNKTETAAYDLRLFRNGQLVGQWPVPAHGMAGPQDPKAWQRASAVPTPRHIFPVPLATKDRGQEVTFTAYAFNEDRVKSETVRASYTAPQDIPARKAKAYVITIGINGYENPHRNLEFAVKDAEDMAFALQRIKDYEVVSVSLLSEARKAGAAAPMNQATKAKIRAVLGVLAGSSDLTALRSIADANKLSKATPDDLVILSFSGHGHTEQGGAFYLLPSDSGTEDAVTSASLQKFISSEELSEWLRDLDAGQMAMIIDACHSAASVDPGGFKPGPMGDRGLGQLAYDKGMRILAASQADNVALEIQNLHQGLLTYALVWDGLRPGQGGKLKADLNGDGQLTLEEWLKYGELRTPSLYDDAKAGKVKMVSRDSKVNPAFIDETTRRAQTPSLFDFHKHVSNVVLQPE